MIPEVLSKDISSSFRLISVCRCGAKGLKTPQIPPPPTPPPPRSQLTYDSYANPQWKGSRFPGLDRGDGRHNPSEAAGNPRGGAEHQVTGGTGRRDAAAATRRGSWSPSRPQQCHASPPSPPVSQRHLLPHGRRWLSPRTRR